MQPQAHPFVSWATPGEPMLDAHGSACRVVWCAVRRELCCMLILVHGDSYGRPLMRGAMLDANISHRS